MVNARRWVGSWEENWPSPSCPPYATGTSELLATLSTQHPMPVHVLKLTFNPHNVPNSQDKFSVTSRRLPQRRRGGSLDAPSTASAAAAASSFSAAAERGNNPFVVTMRPRAAAWGDTAQRRMLQMAAFTFTSLQEQVCRAMSERAWLRVSHYHHMGPRNPRLCFCLFVVCGLCLWLIDGG